MKETTYKKPSEYTATHTLQRFFAKYPEEDALTVSKLLDSAGRNIPEYAGKNEGWLSNKLTGVYYHGLVRPVYSHNPWRKLERVELTTKGKKALGRIEQPEVLEQSTGARDLPARKTTGMTYQDLAKAVAAFRDDNPEFEVTFRVNLREIEPAK